MAPPDLRKLSVVIPCCNEEGNVGRFRLELFDFFKTFEFETEFIAIDDGSTDSTADALERLRLSEPRLTIVRHPQREGLGAALRSGFAEASGDALLTLDADLTFHPRDFPSLRAAYSSGADCVMGSPFLGQMEGVSWPRRWLSFGVNRIYNFLLGASLTATSSLFRLYRTSLLKSLDLHSRSFDINAEIVFGLLRKKARLLEVPATLTRRTWGESKIAVFREIRNHFILFGKILWWRCT